ncbi:MMS19 nucleotide excision repair protein-like protein [Hypsibius exemplaris]|uniref:MMS19 nucleotide excision repair protein n=1 Tax=Hypsibius exemplaris TaxID=2072580 RepID=A0A1W0WR63_HYPEX|nr:MMS19 nucleotide excision repair protein-like protein [Hypsibius exemplaris]
MAANAVESEWKVELLANLKNYDEIFIAALTKDVDAHTRSMLQIVEVVGPSLTSPEVSARQEALRVIVGVVDSLKRDTLEEIEVARLTDFFVNRLQDQQTLFGLTIKGLLALIHMKHFQGSFGVSILDNLATDGFVHSLTRQDRLNVYILFEMLVDRFGQDLEKMGSNLLMRYISVMDGEHEPRNLLIVFRTMVKIVSQFEIDPITETAFDVVACYFPIDFTPTVQEDVESKLKDTLVAGLRRCLTASPKFAKYCLPLILEKLQSDSNDAKEESILTFIALCESGPSVRTVVEEQITSLWISLRREVLTAPTDSIEDAAVKALTSLASLLASGPQLGVSSCDQFVTTVLNDTDQFLRKPELQLQYPTGKILKAVAMSSKAACDKIANIVLPLNVKLFMVQLRTEERLALMNVNALILQAMAAVGGMGNFEPDERTFVAAFYQSLLTETPQNMITCMAVSGLAEMLKLKGFLESDRIDQVCETFMNGMMDYENSGVVDEVTRFFSVAGRVLEEIYIYQKLIPRLLEYIQNREILPLPSRLIDLVQALLRTPRANRSPLFLAKLLDRIQFAEEKGPYVPTMKMYLDIIATYVEGIASTNEAEELYHIVLFPTFRKAIHAATSKEISGFQDIAVLQSLSRIYRWIISRLDHDTFKKLLAALDEMYLSGDTSYRHFTGRADNLGDKLLPSAFKPLEKPYITMHTRCISLMASIVCAAPKNFQFTHDAWKAEVQKLMETCCLCADEQSSVFAAQCIGGILNRIDDHTVLESFIHDALDDPALTRSRSQERRLIRAVVWMAKGLVQRSQATVVIRRLTDMIIRHLKSKKSGEEAADGLRVILEDSEFILNAQMNAVISPLFRQKFFALALPLLMQSFKNAEHHDEAWVKKNHLVALSHLLKYVPQSVAKPSMPQVVPFLIQSLNSDDAELILSTLSSIEELLLESNPGTPSSLETVHIPPLVERLLDLSLTFTNMNVRIAAVKILGHVSTQCEAPPLLPYKQKVLKTLLKCLDDKKRRVREVAVDTRNAWFLVGASIKAN